MALSLKLLHLLMVFIVVFVLLCLLIPKARRQLKEGFNKHYEESKQKNNPYIEAHKTFIDQNEKHYNEYLVWCSKQEPVRIPMDKEIFFKKTENQENYLKELLN